MCAIKNGVLVAGNSREESAWIFDALKEDSLDLKFVKGMEEALRESRAALPDLVISFLNLWDNSGFQLYNTLNEEVLKNEVPFILVLENYDKNNLIVGIELGMDSFILPSFSPERIKRLVMLHLQKSNQMKTSYNQKFKEVCKLVPYAVFVMKNNVIVEANAEFFRLTRLPLSQTQISLNDVVHINVNGPNELAYARFRNGLTSNCTLSMVTLKSGVDTSRYNVFFSFLHKRGSVNSALGVLIPADQESARAQTSAVPTKKFVGNKLDKPAYADASIITNREMEILQLSAKGIPIKQIAEQLHISQRTVEKHRSNIISKTNTENIVEAVFVYGKYIFNS